MGDMHSKGQTIDPNEPVIGNRFEKSGEKT